MAYNNVISRTDAGALIPVDVSKEIIQGIPAASAALSQLRRLPNMPSAQTRMPVLSALPSAYFVTGEPGDGTAGIRGQKQTTEQAWSNKYLNAEEIACIVPIPEAVLDDANYDIWSEIKPRIAEAFGVVIDGAVFFGTNKPSAWPDGIVPSAIAAGNSVELGTGTDIYDDIMGEGGTLSLVEAAGFGVTGHVADLAMKAKLRGLRDSNGVPIFVRSMSDKTGYELDGSPIVFPENGAWDADEALMVSGKFNEAVYAMRQDITYKILDQAVIQDNTGAIIYNLAQQDMVALRCVMRLAWQVPNPINRLKSTEGGKVGDAGADVVGRYPFAVLTPTA
jgi:HK97 family phage major capsid protein